MNNHLNSTLSAFYQRAIGFVFIIASLLFTAIALNVTSNGWITQADIAVYEKLQSMRTPLIDTILIGFTEAGDTIVVVCTTITLLILLLVYKAWRTATFWTAAIVGTALLNTGLKAAVQRTRPIEGLYAGWSNYSFPSGHSAINFAMYASLAIILIRQLQSRWRTPTIIVLLSMAFLVAFSRTYLGAHWASDVIGGISLGTVWLALLSAIYFRQRAEPINVDKFIQAMCFVLFFVGMYNISQQHIDNMNNYQNISVSH